MNNPSSADSDDNADGSKGVRTVSEARRWFATLKRDGVTEVNIPEPFQAVGRGLVIVQASLVRADGARVNIVVYCYDDTPPLAEVDWLPPIPEEDNGNGGLPGWGSFAYKASRVILPQLPPPMRIPAFLLAIVLAVGGLRQTARADGPATIKSVLKLDPEIDCPSCEDGIKHSLATAHGVQSVDVDVLTNRVTIRYDPRNILLKALIGRIRVFGYTTTEVK